MSTPQGQSLKNKMNNLNALFNSPTKYLKRQKSGQGYDNQNIKGTDGQSLQKMKVQITSQIQRVFQPGFDNITNYIKSIKSIVQEQINDQGTPQTQNQNDEIKCVGKMCKLEYQNILLKEQICSKENTLKQYEQLKQQQQQQQKKKYITQIDSLKSKLQTQSKKIQQQIKKLRIENHQSTQLQRKKLIDQIDKIYQNLGERRQTKINGNFQQQFKFQTLSAEIKNLSIKFVQNQKERLLLNKTFNHIFTKFVKIETKNFISSRQKQNTYSFFKEIVTVLTRQILDNPQMNIPNKEFYQKLINFLSQIDFKVDSIISNWNTQLTKATKIIENLNVEKKSLNILISQKEKEIGNLQSDNQKKSLNLQNQVQKVSVLKKEKQKLLNQKSKLGDNINKLQIQFQRTKSDLNKKNEELIKQNSINQTKKSELNNQIKILDGNITELQTSKKKLQTKIAELNKRVQKLQNENSNLSKRLKDQQENNKELNKQIQRLNIQIQRLNKQIQQLNKTVKQNIKIIEKKSQQITQLNEQHFNLNRQYQKSQQKNDQLQSTIKQQIKQIQYLDSIPKFVRCYAQYFNGNLLNYKTIEQTQWFVDEIETYTKKKILSTKFLYRCDPQNRNSFHNYIDCIPHLVVIVKHKNGQVIGAYSEAPLQKGFKCDLMKGLMAGFKNRAVFHVKTQPAQRHNKIINPRPVTWDQNYIIFGNSDLRIIQTTPKADNLEIYSNYGTSNGSYEEKNKKSSSIKDLFTDDIRTSKYLDFEAFSITFQE